MQKYILFTLCIFSSMNGMLSEEQHITTREAHEWDAQEYAFGNRPQETTALLFIKEAGIDVCNKTVLDVGCGTGNISVKVAKTAHHVHGIDASHNMIAYAKKTYTNAKNLTFEHVFAEDFATDHHYDTALVLHCLHWFQNREQAFEKINRALKTNGDMLGTIHTISDPEPITITVMKAMIPSLQAKYSFFEDHDLLQGFAVSYPRDDEFTSMLTEQGFAIVSYEQKTVDCVLKTRDELEAFQHPIIMSRPIVQKMPYLLRQWFFKTYIDQLIAHLKTDAHGFYLFPFNSHVFYARKIVDIENKL